MTVGRRIYRHFLVQGVLAADGQTITIFEPYHADDLPTDGAAKTALAEHVRRLRGDHVLGRSDAVWERISIRGYPCLTRCGREQATTFFHDDWSLINYLSARLLVTSQESAIS